jgi:hypothetical protein
MALSFTVDSFTGITGSSCVSGTMHGNFSGSACGYTGSLSSFTGILTGYISGSYRVSVNRFVNEYKNYIKRSLLKFDLTEVSSSIARGDISNPKFILNLRTIETKEVPLDYAVYAFPLSQSWAMGTGLYANGGSSDGVSWLYKNSQNTSSTWYPNQDPEMTVTGSDYLNSASSASFQRGGGTWYYSAPPSCSNNPSFSFCSAVSGSSYICSQSFSYSTADLAIDITSICKAWVCGCIPNEGLILLTSEELNPSASMNLKFFGRETNTIYSPYIDIKWSDASINTSSLAPVTSSLGVAVSIKGMKSEYKSGNKIRFTVFAREQNPARKFVTYQTNYLTPKFLPSSSFYSIKDNESEETVIGFDDYTRLSCDEYGNFFYLDTTGLPQERYYRILIKSEFSDGSIQIFDDKHPFKITR